MTNPPGAMPPLPAPMAALYRDKTGQKRWHTCACVDGETPVFSAAYMHAYARAYAAPLIARLVELEAELARTERNRDMWKGQCEQQAEHLTDFHGTVPALEKNSQRYQWLRDNADVVFNETQRFLTRSGTWIHSQHPTRHELDAAIDAAIAAKD